jgi:hypothetical protein
MGSLPPPQGEVLTKEEEGGKACTCPTPSDPSRQRLGALPPSPEGREEDAASVGLSNVGSPACRCLSADLLSTQYPVLSTDQGLPTLDPGHVAVLSGEPGLGMTRLGLVMLSGYTEGTVAYLDVRGWLSPVAAWEVGIEPDRLVIARCSEVVQWGRAAAALLDGAVAVMAEIPVGAKDASIRKLAALARNRRTTLLLRPIDRPVPNGVAHLVLEAHEIAWSGAVDGHGRIEQRRTRINASGKAMKGMTRTIEMEDDGSNALRLVSGVAASETRSAAV